MINEIYTDGSYYEKNANWHVEDSPWKAAQIMKIIEKNNISFLSVCEAGCGAGEILNQLYAKMPDDTIFSGYEISEQAFQLAATRKKNRLNFYLKDLIKEPQTFDIVLVIDVIEHISDFYGFLEKIREKGVYKIFHIPLDLSVQTVWRSKPILDGRKQVGHIHYFTKETALAALTDSGYTIIDYMYTAGMLELPNKPFRSKLLSWPRKILYKINPDFAVRVLGGYSLMVLAK